MDWMRKQGDQGRGGSVTEGDVRVTGVIGYVIVFVFGFLGFLEASCRN